MTISDKILQLRKLKDDGEITTEEFNLLKAEVFEAIDTSPPNTPKAHDTAQASKEAASENKTCPQCATSLPHAALICSACGFKVAAYRQNIAGARSAVLQPLAYTQSDITNQIRISFQQQSNITVGCLAPALFLLGFIFALIPIVGWLAAFLCWLNAVILVFAPIRGGMLIEKLTARDAWNIRCATARSQLAACASSLSCPCCDHSPNERMCWPPAANPKVYDCTACGKRSVRWKDKLVYVPHPDVMIKDLGEFAQSK
jgi:hypothetical protein